MFFKSTLIVIFAFSALESIASDNCEEGTFFQKLSQMNGQMIVGDCIVELHVCEKRNLAAALPFFLTEGPKENSHFWLGDLYVKHRNGKSLYVPFYSPESRLPNTRVSLKESKKTINYLYQDKNYDPKSGQKEKYEVIIHKGRPRLELKMKNSRDSSRHPIRSLFFPNLYLNCEEIQTNNKG